MNHIGALFQETLFFIRLVAGDLNQPRDGTAKTERLFSASGVAVGGSDITGILHGGLTSRAYYPVGGIYQTNNETLQQERLKYGVAGDILSHRLFNIWGEPVLEVSLDATTRRRFDPLGRLTNETITAPDATITRTLSYSYQNARLVVTSTDSSDGSTTTAHFDERGLLRRQVVSGGAAPGGVIMRYDTLGRLIEQEDHDDPNHRITTRYFEDSEIPTQITAPQGTQTFTVEAGDNGIVVTGMTWQPTGEQPETIPLTIDAAGRTIRTKLEGVGAVEHAYDAFGNRTAVTAQEGPLKDNVIAAWNYAAGTVTFTDHRANRTITTKAGNNTWLDTTATIAFGHGAAAGLGSDSTRAAITEYLPNRAFTVTRTTRLDGDHLVITEKNGESGIEQTQRINGLGYPVEMSTGDRVTTAGNPAQNDGFPQSWDLPGDADLLLHRNAKGQIEALSHGTEQPAAQAPTTATEDRDNLTLYLGYDAQGRLQTSTDPRGLKLTRAYQGESGVINTVTAGNPNNADNLLLQTENSGSGVSSARRTQRSWLGDEVAIHRGTENPFQTDLIRNSRITRFMLDPATERLKQLTNFEGETTQFAWHEADRRVDITGPDNSNSRLYYDADGQFEALTVQKPDGSYAVQNAVLRDAHNRVQAVHTPTRTTRFHYDGLNLSNIIDTEGRRIHYAEYDEAGRPLRLTLERDTQKQADLAVAYHNNGQPRCITLRPSAGHPERFHFNALGDLVRHERPHRAASEVQFNAWGAPQSLTYDAGNGPETHLLFAEGDNRVLQFPNQVFAEVDTQGRVTTLGYPGLAPKTTDYDAESRPVVISEGNHPARRIAWRDGRVDFLIAEAPVHPAGGTPISETITPAYDATGRVVQLTHADGRGEQFVYPAGSKDLTRLERFTDANGVTQSYRTNLNRLTGVQIEGGPSLNYQYDPAGNLTEVSVANMHTRYEGWQEGYPTQMTWGDGTAFTVTKENGLLKSISSTDTFELSLEYETGGNGLSEDCDQAVNYSGAKLTRVTRAGPDLRETLVPSYNPNHTLGEVRVEREIADTGNGPQKAPETLSFTESYGNGDKQLLTQLTLVLHDQPSPSGSDDLVEIQLRGRSTVQGEGGRIAQQTSEAPRAVVQPADPETTHQVDWTYQPENGNLTQVDAVSTNKQRGRYERDGFRRLRAIERADGSRIEYAYDSGHRRIRAATEGNQTPLIFSYQGSKLIAVGRKEGDGERWTHAVAHDPFGPAFIVDLENSDKI